MASLLSSTFSTILFSFDGNGMLRRDPTRVHKYHVLFDPLTRGYKESKRKLIMCLATHEKSQARSAATSRIAERLAEKKAEKTAYLTAAIASSTGIVSLAVASVYFRFAWKMEGGEVPYLEMLATFSLLVGSIVGMEYFARWAHRDLWHGPIMWNMHESHHRPRHGPFERNDILAVINSIPAIALLFYGSLNEGIFPGLCFGAGLGITIYGLSYMFVHDGLVHQRFPVGPIAHVPFLRKVAAAHQIHHSNKYDGVPFGLFLGEQELEEVEGGMGELEKELNRRIKNSKSSKAVEAKEH